jgi:hypothetical protein
MPDILHLAEVRIREPQFDAVPTYTPAGTKRIADNTDPALAIAARALAASLLSRVVCGITDS